MFGSQGHIVSDLRRVFAPEKKIRYTIASHVKINLMGKSLKNYDKKNKHCNLKTIESCNERETETEKKTSLS